MRATTKDARTFATKYGFNELFYKDKRTHVFYHVEKMMKVNFMPKSSTLRVWKRGFKELYVKKIQPAVMEKYFMFPEKVKLEILVPGSKKDKEVTDNKAEDGATANDARTFATKYGFNELFSKDKRTHVFYHVEKMMKVDFMPKSSTLRVWKRGFKELYVKKIQPAVMEQYFMFPEKVKLEILVPGSKKDKKVTGNKAEDGITKLERPLWKINNDKPKNDCFLTSDREEVARKLVKEGECKRVTDQEERGGFGARGVFGGGWGYGDQYAGYRGYGGGYGDPYARYGGYVGGYGDPYAGYGDPYARHGDPYGGYGDPYARHAGGYARYGDPYARHAGGYARYEDPYGGYGDPYAGY